MHSTLPNVNPILPFTLERAYREHFATGMVDLSSSSPQPLTAREALEEAGVGVESLVNAPLDYEPSGGGLALRGAIASLYGGVSASEVLVTAGAAEAIRVVAEAAIQPGDRVVVQRPVYEPLRAAPLARGAEVLDWAPSSGFQFAFDGLPDGAATAAVVLLNNPHGPSGSLVRGAYAGSARLVADEVYRPASINAAHRAPSVVDVVDGAVSVGDLSKPLGLGGLLCALVSPRGFAVHLTLGSTFERLFPAGWMGAVGLVVGGVMVGFGTRMAGGCTSGHGLSGVSRFQVGSLVATAVFFGTGIATAMVLHRVMA